MKIERRGEQERCLEYKSHNCIGCGICTDICPTGAIKSGPILPIARGLVKMDYININKDKCALCGLCASSCAFNALNFSIDGENIKGMTNYPKWSLQTIFDADTCKYCQNCESVCPREAITVLRTLPKRSNLVEGEIEINKEKCIDCHICEEMCPADAITIKENGKQSFEISVDEDKCVYCLICKRACPEDAIKAICTGCYCGDPQIDSGEVAIKGNIILDEESCINCGWCEDICPVDAVKVIKPFEGEISTTGKEECKGDSCHACQDVCPCKAITVEDGEVQIHQEHCVLCGKCMKVCPQSNISLKRSNMNLDNIVSKSWDKIFSNMVE